MSSENSKTFTKENLNFYLKELSKEYKRLGGREMPVELILIGGAAIIESYGFREMTTDIDAVLPAVSIMQDAINRVGDRFQLPVGWLNADFMKTKSYSRQLRLYSIPYRTFNQVLNVRIVTGEYLIAMKLRAGRKYKYDLSDIVGILAEQEKMGEPISYEMIDTAMKNLYGGWECLTEESRKFMQGIFLLEDYDAVYRQIREEEIHAKQILLEFQEDYPEVLNDLKIVKKDKKGLKRTMFWPFFVHYKTFRQLYNKCIKRNTKRYKKSLISTKRRLCNGIKQRAEVESVQRYAADPPV